MSGDDRRALLAEKETKKKLEIEIVKAEEPKPEPEPIEEVKMEEVTPVQVSPCM